MSSVKNSNPSPQQAEAAGCGQMLVWYFRIASYVGLVVALMAFVTPNNSGMATLLTIVCGGFLLLTRKKKT